MNDVRSDIVRGVGDGLVEAANTGAEGLQNTANGLKDGVQNFADGASKLSDTSLDIYNSEEAMAIRGEISGAATALKENVRTSLVEGIDAAKGAVAQTAAASAKATTEAGTVAEINDEGERCCKISN